MPLFFILFPLMASPNWRPSSSVFYISKTTACRQFPCGFSQSMAPVSGRTWPSINFSGPSPKISQSPSSAMDSRHEISPTAMILSGPAWPPAATGGPAKSTISAAGTAKSSKTCCPFLRISAAAGLRFYGQKDKKAMSSILWPTFVRRAATSAIPHARTSSGD